MQQLALQAPSNEYDRLIYTIEGRLRDVTTLGSFLEYRGSGRDLGVPRLESARRIRAGMGWVHRLGDTKALVKTLCGNVYGIVIGWIALLIIFKTGVADMGPGAIASVVGVTVFLLVIVASIEPLSAVPANVYGYASIVAYALHQASAPGATPDMPGTGPLQAPDRRKLREPAHHPHRLDGDRCARRLSLGTARQGDDEEGIKPRSGHPLPAGPATTPRTWRRQSAGPLSASIEPGPSGVACMLSMQRRGPACTCDRPHQVRALRHLFTGGRIERLDAIIAQAKEITKPSRARWAAPGTAAALTHHPPVAGRGHDRAPDVRRRFGMAQRLDPAPVAFVGLEGMQPARFGAHPAGHERDGGDRVGSVGHSP